MGSVRNKIVILQMNFLPTDFTSVVWGVALGALGVFGSGFLKKAGEDCYFWIRDKLGLHRSEHRPTQGQVVIQVTQNDQTSNSKPLPKHLDPVSIERVSVVDFAEIKDAIAKAPPLQRELVAKSYVGLMVEWDTYLLGGSRLDNDRVKLLLTTDHRNTVMCEVPFSDYRELGILQEGARIRVVGEISEADRWYVKLKDARLYIQGSDNLNSP